MNCEEVNNEIIGEMNIEEQLEGILELNALEKALATVVVFSSKMLRAVRGSKRWF